MVDGVPTGFRFYPTEAELVDFYLRNKLDNTRPEMERFIPVVDVYSYEPTELPQRSGEASVGDPEQWFFFCPRQQREARGGRPTRTTRLGYWKATGSPTPVFHNNRVIGIKKTMVFYHGRPPTGRKTAWKMNEYRATTTQQASTSTSKASLELRSEFSVCRVYKKSGPLRSFDRRPVMAAMAGGNAGDGQPRRPPAGTSSSSQGNSASATVDREPSQGSSPSDGGQDPGPVDATGGGDDDWEMQLEGVDWDSLADFDDF